MKRTALSLFFVICLSLPLTACGLRATPQDFSPAASYRLRFEMTKGDFVCGGTAACADRDNIRLDFEYPEGLSYFNVALRPDGLTARIGDTEDAILPEALPAASPLRLLLDALRAFTYAPQAFTKNENGDFVCAGTFGDAETRGVFSPEGLPRAIECDAMGLSVAFTEEDPE